MFSCCANTSVEVTPALPLPGFKCRYTAEFLLYLLPASLPPWANSTQARVLTIGRHPCST